MPTRSAGVFLKLLGKMLVFCFCFLGIFALLMPLIPSDFVTASYAYNPSYRDVEIEEEFEANNMLVYDNNVSDNMTYTYESIYDAPSPPQWTMGLPSEDYVNVMWFSVWWAGNVPGIGIRLVHRHWFGPVSWYTISEESTFYNTAGSRLGGILELSDLEAYWNDGTNSTAFVMKMRSITSNFIIRRYNSTETLEQNWNDGTLGYFLTYDANFTQSGVGAFTIVGSLLGFSAPNLGITGTWGTFLNMVIAIPMWSCIAYIVYKVIAGLIPFVSGGSGD